MIRTEWIHCNACGSDDFQELCVVDRWHVGKCRQCSLLYVNPMPFFGADNFGDVTSDFYYTRWQQQALELQQQFAASEFRLQASTFTQWRGHCNGSPRRLLDVGCGVGLTVKAATDAGWEAMGVDIDETLVALGREKLGADLRCSTLADCQIPRESFDFIRLKFVLEHLPNPRQLLERSAALLKPSGVLLIIVPNEAGLINQLKLAALGARPDRWGTLIAPHHLHAFTPDTLGRLLTGAGFTPRRIFTVSPRDPCYGTYDQFQSNSLRRRLMDVAWTIARWQGRGSVLVAWATV
jgi:SAM-dependent methyltransferase